MLKCRSVEWDGIAREGGGGESMAISAPKDVIYCPVDGEMVLLRLSEGNYYGLNEVAAKIFSSLNEGFSAEQVVERLQAEFEVDAPTAQAAVSRIIAELLTKGLVVQEQPE